MGSVDVVGGQQIYPAPGKFEPVGDPRGVGGILL
jgi:hypothetical protein